MKHISFSVVAVTYYCYMLFSRIVVMTSLAQERQILAQIVSCQRLFVFICRFLPSKITGKENMNVCV